MLKIEVEGKWMTGAPLLSYLLRAVNDADMISDTE